MNPPELRPSDALLIVDVQRDFCPGGALAVPDGDAVVPVLNQWIDAARDAGAAVFASRDWHPPDHVSFQEQGGPWPSHCVAETDGARFHPISTFPNRPRSSTREPTRDMRPTPRSRAPALPSSFAPPASSGCGSAGWRWTTACGPACSTRDGSPACPSTSS